MLIDTHMHIGEDFGVRPNQLVENAKKVGVEVLIASFCEKKDFILCTKFLNQYENLYACVGFHPEFANTIEENDYLELENMIKNNSKIVAIGEIGLDYYWTKDNKEKQREVFCKQLEIAERFHLPVVIHSRDAIGETYDILKNYHLKGVIHCFGGSLEMAQKFIDLGFDLGIGGVVTFKNSKLPEVIAKIGISNIVLETDSPYLAPEPNRGKINEPANIPDIAFKIADILNLSLEEVEKITTENAIKLFDLPLKL